MKNVRFDPGCGRSILLALLVSAAAAFPSHAQTRQATLVDLGMGEYIYSWYYDFEAFCGYILMDIDGVVTELSGPQTFQVERLQEGTLPSADPQVVAAFWRQVEERVGRAVDGE